MYYNTTNEQGEDLRELINKSMNQEQRVIEFFKVNPELELTPPEVLNELFSLNTPLTSVRRAISDATTKGRLQQTKRLRKGDFGRLNYCWKYKA